LGILINGDDYFGKFITRVFLNQKITTRCDGGMGRFSLSVDGSIYSCPGALGISDLELGSISSGLNWEKINRVWETQIGHSDCQGCEARFTCGGECMVTAFYNQGTIHAIDPIMCALKKHLFHLAVQMKYELFFFNQGLFKIIVEACEKKRNRFSIDLELQQVLNSPLNKIPFTRLKQIKDHDLCEFKKIQCECGIMKSNSTNKKEENK
jgi:uncharacterized protein